MPELSFFIGKGGVGKTTVSTAYALRTAALHPRKSVLLLSTDPAHSTADILQVKLPDKPMRIKTKGKLWAWQINAEQRFREFLEPYRDSVLNLMEAGTLFSREEIEPLLDTTLPGMAEVAALLAIDDLLNSSEYDHIIVDTAPIGHTLRLFEMPQHFAKFLHFLDVAGSRDQWLAQRFGGRNAGIEEAFLTKWRETVDSVQQALSAENSDVFLVTSPEKFSLNEAARSADALEAGGSKMRVTALVLNRVVTDKTTCESCRNRVAMYKDALKSAAENFSGLRVYTGEDPGQPILGAADLLRFSGHVFAKKPLRITAAAPRAGAAPKVKRASWPELQTQLSFTLGKGGVGKTTISAALAVHQRAVVPKKNVTVCSTDPAPSLDDVFNMEVPSRPVVVLGDKHLHAIEVDSLAEFREWAEEMQRKIANAMSGESGGLHVDLSFDREVFSALLDIVPPGVDEIFAIFKILDLAKEEATVVIDMAPTGHALELLRMPERMQLWARLLLKSLAPHRTLPLAQDVAVEIATLGQQVRELVKRMQDPKRAMAFAVMLPEPLPKQQTLRLLTSVNQLNIAVGGIFVNRVIIEKKPLKGKACPRCARAERWQRATLSQLKRSFRGHTIYIVKNYPEEVAGREALEAFTRPQSIWQLA